MVVPWDALELLTNRAGSYVGQQFVVNTAHGVTGVCWEVVLGGESRGI